MHSFVNIKRHPYEEPYLLNLVLSAGNPTTQAEFEIYAEASELKAASTALCGFPKRDGDSFVLEIGSENEKDRFAFYFRLRVFEVSSNGRCGIELRFNNNQKPPNQQIVEFCIEAYPADIDRLAKMLDRFSQLEDLMMEWTVHPGT